MEHGADGLIVSRPAFKSIAIPTEFRDRIVAYQDACDGPATDLGREASSVG